MWRLQLLLQWACMHVRAKPDMCVCVCVCCCACTRTHAAAELQRQRTEGAMTPREGGTAAAGHTKL
jgi:hypothetical protein